MRLLRATNRRRIGGTALCLTAMLGAEATRAGDVAPVPATEGAILVAYAVATPEPRIEVFRRTYQRAVAPPATAPTATRVGIEAFASPAGPAADPRRPRAWPTPDHFTAPPLGPGRAATTAADLEIFDEGPSVAWDLARAAAARDRFAPAGWVVRSDAPSDEAEAEEDDAEDLLGNLLAFTGKVSENTSVKLRYSKSRKRMKGLSVIFAWDF